MMRNLLTACEQAKQDLSAMTEIDVVIDNFHRGEDLIVRVQRSEFEAECADLFGRLLTPVENALAKCRMRAGDINEVLLVGGSSSMPRVRQLLSQFFPGQNLISPVNPLEAVVRGAVLIAAKKKAVRELKPFDIRDA
jgi:L1 cell adhesion molecule like protein